MAWTVGLLAAGCSAGGGAPEVAATVGLAKIQSSAIDSATREYLRSQAGKDLEHQMGRDEVGRLVLGFRIKNALLAQVASDMGVTVPADPLERGFSMMGSDEAYRQAGFSTQDLVDANRAGRLSKALAEKIFPRVPVPEDEVRTTFEQHGPVFQQAWRVGADVAIFNSADSCRQLRERVLRGGSFSDTASTLGALQTGSIEVTPISPIPQVFVDAIGQLRNGDISEPVAAGSSWFTVRVNHREDFAARSFEEVKPEVVALLTDEKRQGLFQDWFNRKLHAAPVRVEKYYGKWDPSSGTVTG
jgi:hypothetical protein